MFDFDKLCKEVESIDPFSYMKLLDMKCQKVMPILQELNIDNLNGINLFYNFVLTAIFSDGIVTEDEFYIIQPSLKVVFGDELTFEDCNNALENMGEETEKHNGMVDEMLDLLGEVSDELKNDLFTIVLLVCAVDGEISRREKKWLKRLLK